MRQVLADRVAWCLAALCLLLATLAVWQWQTGTETGALPALDAAGDGGAESPLPSAPEFPQRSVYQEVVERPLFVASRRPAPAAQPVTARVADYEIEGTALGPDGGVVLLRDRRSREVRRVRAGETVDGWTIVEVGEGWALLDRAGRSLRLELELPGANRSTPGAVRATGAQARADGAAPD